MTNLFTTGSKKTIEPIQKKWLFIQESDNVPVSSKSGWNEDYQPSNKFLYFSESTSTLSEKKIKNTSCLN